jgi:hypothetical protein
MEISSENRRKHAVLVRTRDITEQVWSPWESGLTEVWVQRGTTDTPFFDIFQQNGELAGHAVFPEDGWSWTFTISPQGILAWEADPDEGYQRLFVLE